MRIINITGMNVVRRNLRACNAKVGAGFAAGLKTAGLFLLAESMRLVPVQTGNLKGSSFCRTLRLLCLE